MVKGIILVIIFFSMNLTSTENNSLEKNCLKPIENFIVPSSCFKKEYFKVTCNSPKMVSLNSRPKKENNTVCRKENCSRNRQTQELLIK